MGKPILVVDWDGTLAFSESVDPDNQYYPMPLEEDGSPPRHDAGINNLKGQSATLSIDRNGVVGETRLFIRPYAFNFLSRMSKYYRLVLWSYGVEEYIRQCLIVSRMRTLFEKVIVRENMRIPLKDLAAIEKDLTHIAIVDDSNATFGLLNPYNCINVPSWFPAMEDDRVFNVLPLVVDFHFQYVLRKRSTRQLLDLRNNALRSFLQRRDGML